MTIPTSPFLGSPPEDLQSLKILQDLANGLFEDRAPDMLAIQGRFELRAKLGSGGQGTVYRAWDRDLDRMVALKRLAHRSTVQKARMQREAKALGRVTHPNVVAIYDVGDDESGQPYLVMELLEGLRLDQWLRQERRSWTTIVEHLAAVGDGLQAIHDAGVVHRDVKPHNIVVSESEGREEAKLLDLGIAIVRDPGAKGEGSPRSPSTEGTVGYIAPEHFGGKAGPRSDQFAFCVTLYEALFGTRPPWSMTSTQPPPIPEQLHAPAKAAPATRDTEPELESRQVASGTIPRHLYEILNRGLQLKPEDRYEAMSDLVAELRALLPRRRRWGLVGAFAGGAAVATALLFGSLAPDACDDPNPAGSLWSEPVRAEVQGALETPGSETGARAFATIDGMLGETVSVLDSRWNQACEAETEATSRQMSLAELRSQQIALQAVVSSLTEVEPEKVAEAPVRLAGLLGRIMTRGPQDACEQTEVLLEPTPELERIEELRLAALAAEAKGDYDEALSQWSGAITEAQADTLRPVRARLHLERGRTALEAMQLDVARPDLEAARALSEPLGCDGVGSVALALGAKTELLDGHGDISLAALASALAVEKAERIDARDARLAEALKNRGLLLQRQHAYDEAIERYQQALEVWRSLDPPDPLGETNTMLNLAVSLDRSGRTDEAVELLLDAIELRGETLWPDHPSLYKLHASLSYRYLSRGELEASSQSLDRALELATVGFGPRHPRVVGLHVAMARVLDYSGDFDGAMQHAQTADRISVALYGPDDLRRIDALEAIGQVGLDAGRAEQAVSAFEAALQIQAASGESKGVDLGIGRGKLAQARALAGDHDKALLLYEEAYRPFDADPSIRSNAYLPELWLGWGETLLALGRHHDAATRLREAERRWRASADNPERLAHAQWGLARASCVAAPDEAEGWARRALQGFEELDTPGALAMRETISSWLEQPCSSDGHETNDAATNP